MHTGLLCAAFFSDLQTQSGSATQSIFRSVLVFTVSSSDTSTEHKQASAITTSYFVFWFPFIAVCISYTKAIILYCDLLWHILHKQNGSVLYFKMETWFSQKHQVFVQYLMIHMSYIICLFIVLKKWKMLVKAWSSIYSVISSAFFWGLSQENNLLIYCGFVTKRGV